MLKLHLHLFLGSGELGTLVSISYAASLNLVLKLKVLLVSLAFLSQNVLNLRVAHVLLIFKVLDARLGNRDVNLNQVVLLTSLVGLLLGLLGQLTIFQTLSLKVVVPAIVEDLLIELLNIKVETVTLLFLVLLCLFFLGHGEFALLDGTVGRLVLGAQLRENLRAVLLLLIENRPRVGLLVACALQSSNRRNVTR